MSTLLNVLLLFLALLFLLLIHELGHWALARWCGVRVSRLTLGFGPHLVTFAQAPQVTLRLLPIAASVQFARSDPAGDEYLAAPAWKRGLIDLGGPLASYAMASAIVLFLSLTGFLAPAARVVVASVEPGSRAERLGVVVGSPAERLSQLHDGPPEELGVTVQRARTPASLGTALELALLVPVELTRDQVSALQSLVFRGERERVQGPVSVARELVAEAQRGFFSFASAMALVSVAIGFFNLLPIPGLDGGKLVFSLGEVVFGRRLSQRWVSRVQAVSLTVLLLVVAALSACELNFPWLAIPAIIAVPVFAGALAGVLRAVSSRGSEAEASSAPANPWRKALSIGAAAALALSLLCALIWDFWLALLVVVPIALLVSAASGLVFAGLRWSRNWRLG